MTGLRFPRFKLHGALLVYLALGFSAWCAEADPLIDGKKVSEWRTLLLGTKDEERERQIFHFVNVKSLPKELFPVLLELLPNEPRDWPMARQALPHAIAHVCEDAPATAALLFAELDKGTEDRRIVLLEAVRELHQAALPAVPKMLDLANDTNQSGKIRYCALAVISNVKGDAATVLPRLMPLLKDANKELRGAALGAIGRYGAAANDRLPDLMQVMRNEAEDRTIRGEAALAIGHMGAAGKEAVPALIELLSGMELSHYASEALGLIGPDAATAVPALIRALSSNNPYRRSCAAEALGHIGPAARPAVPELIRLAQIERQDERHSIAAALGNLGPDAPEALPVLIKLIRDDNWGGSNPSPIEDAVMKIASASWWEGTCDRSEVEKQIPVVRRKAIYFAFFFEEAQGSYGSRVTLRLLRAVPRFAVRLGVNDRTLTQILAAAEKHSDADVRRNAEVAREEWKTGILQPLPPPKPLAASKPVPAQPAEAAYNGHTLKEWTAALNNEREKFEAMSALPHFGPEGARVILRADHGQATAGLDLSGLNETELTAIAPVLIEALKDKDVLVRRPAPEWIVHLPSEVRKTAIPALIDALSDEDIPVRRWAAQALGKIGTDAKDAVPQLIIAMQSTDKDLSSSALGALSGIGPAAKEAIPVLIARFRNSKNDFDRCFIPLTLGKIGPATPEVLPLMLEALKDKGHNTRNFAAQGLGEMHASEAIPALIDVLKDLKEMSLVRISAAEALDKIGGSKDAIPALAAAAKEQTDDWQLRGAAMKALAHLDKDSSTALPVFQEMLADKNALVQIKAAETIGELGDRALAAVPALAKLLEDRNDKVEGRATARLLAIQALAKMTLNDKVRAALETATSDPYPTNARLAKEALSGRKKP